MTAKQDFFLGEKLSHIGPFNISFLESDCIIKLLTIGGQTRAKTHVEQCVLHLIAVMNAPLCLPLCLPPLLTSSPFCLPPFSRGRYRRTRKSLLRYKVSFHLLTQGTGFPYIQ